MPRQLSLLDVPAPDAPLAVSPAAEAFGAGRAGERGAVYTKPDVVEFVLGLGGLDDPATIREGRILEPSCGRGDFVVPIVRRLLAGRGEGTADERVTALSDRLRAVELNADALAVCRRSVDMLLDRAGFPRDDRRRLLDAWLLRGDFLTCELPGRFDVVAGNPPYVRLEAIPKGLLEEYRQRFSTFRHRSDLYIPFLERGLRLLKPGGRLAVICADRWMKNRYGGALRRLVADRFHLEHVADMTGLSAFAGEVTAYPAVTVVTNRRGRDTVVASGLRPSGLCSAASAMRAAAGGGDASDPRVRVVRDAASGADPWLLDGRPEIALLRRLEANFPTLEEAGCRVGIGVATGADRVFLGPFDALPVEPDRKLPLATTADIAGGRLSWTGRGVVNPFRADGSLVDLEEYPKLRRYLERNRPALAARHIAKRRPERWYRTIDRIDPRLTDTPKLLIPDIKGEPVVALDRGGLYPHHNLYYVTSSVWPLAALRAALLSGVARLFVSQYSTKMRGGYFRFQAQHLRRIRLPRWRNVPPPLRAELAAAGAEDVPSLRGFEPTCAIFGLTAAESRLLADLQSGPTR